MKKCLRPLLKLYGSDFCIRKLMERKENVFVPTVEVIIAILYYYKGEEMSLRPLLRLYW